MLPRPSSIFKPKPPMRLSLMASHLSNSAPKPQSSPALATSLSALPRSSTLTSRLPPDPQYPTPQKSHAAPRGALLPRLVRGGFYTFVRPTRVPDPELLAVSPAALQDLGLAPSVTEGEEFLQVLSGNRIIGWEDVADGGEGKDVSEEASEDGDSSNANSEKSYDELKVEATTQQKDGKIYPWAQCYGGFQFGSWAGQLGDGRAHSLFEITNQSTQKRYELQLKGGGKTPYSRFADGRAVLRSSIREFIVSEALNALGIKTTRALSLVLTEKTRVLRERTEPGAIVGRFAESWVRLGTFDLLRARADRKMIRQLAEYVAEEVLGGWQKLSAALPEKGTENGVNRKPATTHNMPYSHLTREQLLSPGSGVARDETQNSGSLAQNRFARIYRTIARLNAITTAHWQLYGFTNGVLNTDNTSVLGLSLDFGPFSFIDVYDPSFTPNHDDHALRYSYGNQPSVIWWNLVRLGEAFGELMGAGARVDEQKFIEADLQEEDIKEVQERGEALIMRTGEEYKAVLRAEFTKGMARRLGLKNIKDTDFDALFSSWLDTMQSAELDFNHSFRRLGGIAMSDLASEAGRLDKAEMFFTENSNPIIGLEEAKKRVAAWLEKYRARTLEDWGEDDDAERKTAMDSVNPKFLPRNWILDEVIQRVEKDGERDVLKRVLNMALNPFSEEWGADKAEEERFCGDVPKYKTGMQCSCSS